MFKYAIDCLSVMENIDIEAATFCPSPKSTRFSLSLLLQHHVTLKDVNKYGERGRASEKCVVTYGAFF